MPVLTKTTRFLTKKEADAGREWVVIDVAGQPLGRVCSKIASILKGKNKPTYSPDKDMGDFVIVLNAAKVKLTGKKLSEKEYFTHSGRPGGGKSVSYERLMAEKPHRIIEIAVKGMLPTNPFGKRLLKKMSVYAGEEHPHKAQNPKKIEA